MYHILHKYLVLHHQLVVPQVGLFYVEKESASYQNDTGLLSAPRSLIHFTQKHQSGTDKFFFEFLIRETGLEESAAIRDYLGFAEELQAELKEKKTTIWKGVGTLFLEDNDTIRFERATDLQELLPPVAIAGTEFLDAAVAEDEVAAETAKDYWWYYAIILLILGLGALAYYYI
jgi:hypothetical protein